MSENVATNDNVVEDEVLDENDVVATNDNIVDTSTTLDTRSEVQEKFANQILAKIAYAKDEVEVLTDNFVNLQFETKGMFLKHFHAFDVIILADIPCKWYNQTRAARWITSEVDMRKKYFTTKTGKEILTLYVNEKLHCTMAHKVIVLYKKFATVQPIFLSATQDGFNIQKLLVLANNYENLVMFNILKPVHVKYALECSNFVNDCDNITTMFVDTAELTADEKVRRSSNQIRASLIDNTSVKDFEVLVLALIAYCQHIEVNLAPRGRKGVTVKEVKDKITSIKNTLEKIEFFELPVVPMPVTWGTKEGLAEHAKLAEKHNELLNIEGMIAHLKSKLKECSEAVEDFLIS